MKTKIIKNLILDNGGISEAEKGVLTVFDTLPYRITWSYNDMNHKIEHKNKLIPLLLKDNQHIAIIQAPCNKELNGAYIVNGDGNIVWRLMDLLKEQRSLNQLVFSDVYYINNSLYFFVVISNIDYRFEFNLCTGKMGDLIESR